MNKKVSTCQSVNTHPQVFTHIFQPQQHSALKVHLSNRNSAIKLAEIRVFNMNDDGSNVWMFSPVILVSFIQNSFSVKKINSAYSCQRSNVCNKVHSSHEISIVVLYQVKLFRSAFRLKILNVKLQ